MSNWRWIIGAQLGFVLNHLGLVCAWDCNLASVLKQVAHQQADYFRARMAFILSAFNLLVQWHGVPMTDDVGGPVTHLRLPAQRLLAFLLLRQPAGLDRESEVEWGG